MLLSKEGIAKSVRRITGVTMKDAAVVTAAVANFEAKVTDAGSFHVSQVKFVTVELDGISISSAKKIQL